MAGTITKKHDTAQVMIDLDRSVKTLTKENKRLTALVAEQEIKIVLLLEKLERIEKHED